MVSPMIDFKPALTCPGLKHALIPQPYDMLSWVHLSKYIPKSLKVKKESAVGTGVAVGLGVGRGVAVGSGLASMATWPAMPMHWPSCSSMIRLYWPPDRLVAISIIPPSQAVITVPSGELTVPTTT